MATQISDFHELPSDVQPINYQIKLQPFLDKFTFDGSMSIKVVIRNCAHTVVLNAAALQVHTASFQSEGSGEKLGVIMHNESNETVTISFETALLAGEGNLHLTFAGTLNESMKGFYRTKQILPSGEVFYGASTHFEATDARRAFPCWDEPAIRATFDITLVVPDHLVALSNMPVVKDTPLRNNLRELLYETTPSMSTYLVAFVIGLYDFVETTTDDTTKVRVYTPKGKSEQGKFALDVAAKALQFYKEYFQIPYLLPKLDLIAVADFPIGAMENWGLVTYREMYLLIDPETSSPTGRQNVALTVGHELAHMWFGNLVTVQWWTHLWLKEGFAKWIEYLCVNHLYKEFDIWTQFVSSPYARALELDSLDNSHAIEVEVKNPAEIFEIFDTVSYCKGASIIRMLHQYVGDLSFRQGLTKYLTKFSYKSAVTENLWECLEEASQMPVGKVMSTWTNQMGYPVVTVDDVQDGNNRRLTLSQVKFSSDGNEAPTNAFWMIPIEIVTSKSDNKSVMSFVLDKNPKTVTLDELGCSDWVKINPESVGFYRVRYSPHMVLQLSKGVKTRSLSARDRFALVSDLFALARAGVASTVNFLKFLQYYKQEENYTVWVGIANMLNSLGCILQHTDFYKLFEDYSRELFDVAYEELGWETHPTDGHLQALLRALIIGCCGRYNNEHCIQEAQKRFEGYCNGTHVLPANLKKAVYQTVLSHGTEQSFYHVIDIIKKAGLHEEKVQGLISLGCIKDVTLKKKVLEYSLSDEVRSQDVVTVFVGVAGSSVGQSLVWDFMKENWPTLI